MDTAAHTAFDDSAPQAERTDALAQLMATYRPSDDAVRAAVEFINDDLQTQALQKSIADNVVPFPPKRRGQAGMQSVDVDEFQILLNGDYIDRPGVLSFDSMRAMVEQTPILSSVILTRVRQVQRFCRTQESGTGSGFAIRHIDRDHKLTQSEMESIQLMQRFFDNCGWEFNPRQRRRLKRDSFTQFMSKMVADSLTMDSCAIETEMKRDRRLGIDGLYAVDGATIRLCSENGYNGDDEIFALQVVNGQIRTAYTFEDLVYEPRNPRSSVLVAGYGQGEVEVLVRTVTGYLNALTYNNKYFDSNSIPKGVLHMTGAYGESDVAAFKRFWNSMVKGVNNSWVMPVMISKDQDSKVSFEKFGVEQNEMMFARWMTFLTSIICAVYGMDPAEINSDSFSAGTSPLSGSDTETRLAASRDKGLWPLLTYFENLFTDFIVHDFSDKFCFRWTGKDDDDEERRYETRKLVMTVDEMRARESLPAHADPTIGNAPLNSSLTGIYMQGLQGSQGDQEDFGQPPGEGADAQEQAAGGAGDDNEGQPGGPKQGDPGEAAQGEAPQGQGQDGQKPDFGKDGGLDFGKAMGAVNDAAQRFGLPLVKIWGDE